VRPSKIDSEVVTTRLGAARQEVPADIGTKHLPFRMEPGTAQT
jgi:hypothetical protein